MSIKRVCLILPVLMVLLAACAAPPTPEPTATPAPTATPTEVPPTATPEPTPVDPLSIGDPEAGRDMFETGADALGNPCIRCHSLDDDPSTPGEYGPSLKGISERAGERVEGLSAVDYLHQSILDPSAYLVEGYDDNMEKFYELLLDEQQVNNMVAFLLTQ